MNWTKIPTNLLVSRTPDNELVSIVKYQLLWADLEYKPTDEIALRYMSCKQLALVKQYLHDIEAQVVADITSTTKHRGTQKTFYKKKQQLTQNADGQHDGQCDNQCVNQADGADKIRLDKIRKEKEINKEKKLHGEYGKVRLTDEEYQKLQELYGDKREAAIQELDGYLAESAKNGKKYTNHYAVLRRNNWVYNKVFGIKQQSNTPEKSTVNFTELVGLWNEMAKRLKLQPVSETDIMPERKTEIQKIVDAKQPKDLKDLINQLEQVIKKSPKLLGVQEELGSDGRWFTRELGWKASFAFCFSTKGWADIMTGKYNGEMK